MTPLRSALAIVLWAIAFGTAGMARQSSSAAPPKMLVIKGSETPDLIPEHALWRQTFFMLAAMKFHKLNERLESIGLSEPELEAVLKVAEGEEGRHRECDEAIRNKDTGLRAQGLDLKAVYQGHYDVILACRQRTLDVRDRLLASLSPQGQATLVAWVESRRVKMTFTIAEHEAEFFKLPR
jgi:hypothetical protein